MPDTNVATVVKPTIWTAVLSSLKRLGRVAVCGAIAGASVAVVGDLKDNLPVIITILSATGVLAFIGKLIRELLKKWGVKVPFGIPF